jgi:hypothetical protein
MNGLRQNAKLRTFVIIPLVTFCLHQPKGELHAMNLLRKAGTVSVKQQRAKRPFRGELEGMGLEVGQSRKILRNLQAKIIWVFLSFLLVWYLAPGFECTELERPTFKFSI